MVHKEVMENLVNRDHLVELVRMENLAKMAKLERQVAQVCQDQMLITVHAHDMENMLLDHKLKLFANISVLSLFCHYWCYLHVMMIKNDNDSDCWC
ncbi:unnamed protein product [Wuchereria bancrofti]|uniref:Uncharacterized protein n=1 Tax=Wuchereria bancrofti TaxID=6293 RepID=A0A3P7DNV9_WUCBA|nr:unnamed protein product [Wuchereria bancrofti]